MSELAEDTLGRTFTEADLRDAHKFSGDTVFFDYDIYSEPQLEHIWGGMPAAPKKHIVQAEVESIGDGRYRVTRAIEKDTSGPSQGFDWVEHD